MPERRFRNIRSKSAPWKRIMATRMSRNPSFPEKLLWASLREGVNGVRCHKQKVVLGYILDFWIPRAGLCIEVDGPHHLKQAGYDKHRDLVLKARGIETMRFTAQAVTNNRPAVMAMIVDKVCRRMK